MSNTWMPTATTWRATARLASSVEASRAVEPLGRRVATISGLTIRRHRASAPFRGGPARSAPERVELDGHAEAGVDELHDGLDVGGHHRDLLEAGRHRG